MHTTRLLTLIVTLAALLKWRLSLLSGEAPEPALTQNPAMHLQSRAAQVVTAAQEHLGRTRGPRGTQAAQ